MRVYTRGFEEVQGLTHRSKQSLSSHGVLQRADKSQSIIGEGIMVTQSWTFFFVLLILPPQAAITTAISWRACATITMGWSGHFTWPGFKSQSPSQSYHQAAGPHCPPGSYQNYWCRWAMTPGEREKYTSELYRILFILMYLFSSAWSCFLFVLSCYCTLWCYN